MFFNWGSLCRNNTPLSYFLIIIPYNKDTFCRTPNDEKIFLSIYFRFSEIVRFILKFMRSVKGERWKEREEGGRVTEPEKETFWIDQGVRL